MRFRYMDLRVRLQETAPEPCAARTGFGTPGRQSVRQTNKPTDHRNAQRKAHRNVERQARIVKRQAERPGHRHECNGRRNDNRDGDRSGLRLTERGNDLGDVPEERLPLRVVKEEGKRVEAF